MTAGANQYYTGESPAQLRVALSEDIPALFNGQINPAITPVWTAQWTFSPSGNVTAVVINAKPGQLGMQIAAGPLYIANNLLPLIAFNASGANFGLLQNVSSTSWALGYGGSQVVAGTSVITWDSSNNTKLAGPLGINGNAPPAQVTGWGTPTSPSVVNNFSGTAATTAQIQAAIAEIIAALKAVGIFGA